MAERSRRDAAARCGCARPGLRLPLHADRRAGGAVLQRGRAADGLVGLLAQMVRARSPRNSDILSAALNTLIVALVSTAIATLLGTLLALGVEMRRRRGTALEALIFAPMIIPDIVLAIALLSFFSHAQRHHGPAHHRARACRVQPRLRLLGGARPAEDLRLVDRRGLAPISAPRRSPPSGASRCRSSCRPSSPARCSPSRCRSTSSSSPSSPPAPGAPRPRCRCRSIR